MADDDQTQTQDPPERTVPYARFKEVNDRLAEERKARSELENRIASLEDADKPHLERLTKDLERAAKRAEEAEKRAQEVEAARQRDQKAAWLTSAAAKHNFHDPDIAARMVNLDEIEDAKTAERYVKDLAKEKAFLVKEEPKQSPLQRVATGTEQDYAGQPQQGLVTEEELQRQWGLEVLKGLDPSAVPDAS